MMTFPSRKLTWDGFNNDVLYKKNESEMCQVHLYSKKIKLKTSDCGLELVVACCGNQHDTRHENAIIYMCYYTVFVSHMLKQWSQDDFYA